MTGRNVFELVDRCVDVSSIRDRLCFACGGQPSGGKGEHIFPLWLQNQFDLKDRTLRLLNGTTIPYRNLTVPCCVDCNTKYLSSIEKSMVKIIEKGAVESANDELICARWAIKIFLGILIKETGLKLDRASPHDHTIVPPEFIEDMRHLYFIFQTGRVKSYFNCLHHHFPFSFYSYKIRPSKYDNEELFNFSTHIGGQSVSLRIGSLGFLFVSDGGMQMEISKGGPFDLNGEIINSAQFSELTARFHYKSSLRIATHSYITSIDDQSAQVIQSNVLPLDQNSILDDGFSLFADWNELEFLPHLEQHLDMTRAQLYDEEAKQCYTFIFDENGLLRQD